MFVTYKNQRFFQIYWSVDFLILFVCPSVCFSPTCHNFKLIFMKLHHMVEFVISKKPIVSEVKKKRVLACWDD